MESGPSRGSAAQKRPVRTQAVIDQSDMYTHVLSSFTERKVRRTGSCEFPPKRFQPGDVMNFLLCARRASPTSSSSPC